MFEFMLNLDIGDTLGPTEYISDLNNMNQLDTVIQNNMNQLDTVILTLNGGLKSI